MIINKATIITGTNKTITQLSVFQRKFSLKRTFKTLQRFETRKCNYRRGKNGLRWGPL